jgi:transcriptional coactivator HFI1/ADA1
LEIRKRFGQPLAVESGEFPDVSNIESRMLPYCYEAGLTSGHSPDAAHLVSLATEIFIKEMLSSVFSRTRSNAPGDSSSAGLGPGSNWIQTYKYKKQLAKEEELAQKRETSRDKTGLLPVEAKAASERGPLGMADLRIALEMGDCGMSNFSTISKGVIYSYREGELENWEDYTWVGKEKNEKPDEDVEMSGIVNGKKTEVLTNGINHADQMDLDHDEAWWEGAEIGDGDFLNGVLDVCLALN